MSTLGLDGGQLVDWADLGPRVQFLARDAVLELAVRASFPVAGEIVEFGVADGGSTRVLRRVLSRLERDQAFGPRKRIFACDSFEGLPERFEKAEVGTFACDPPEIQGVEIVAGYFQDSLTDALARRVGSVSLASFDADLYSSTITALRWITPLLHTGSLLLFDEFLGENESEKRAFQDWSREKGILTAKVAEFGREPAGWGTRLDSRALFQVIGKDPLQTRRVVRWSDALRALVRPRAIVRRLRGLP